MAQSVIRLEQCEVCKGVVHYHFSVTNDIARYFNRNILIIEYPCDVTSVPESVLAVPFVADLLPAAWLLEADIVVKSLDEDFYQCISNVIDGYHTVYPKWKFNSKVVAANLEKSGLSTNRSAALFSGGLDAVTTMLTHLGENPDLISIWGSDVRYGNADGWRVVDSQIEKVVALVNKPKHLTIRSDFREIDDEIVFNSLSRAKINETYWLGIKHSLPLLGMVAPIAYLNGYSTLYIASTDCKMNGILACASNPWSDNAVRFCGCNVVHDGYEYSRQMKAEAVVAKCKELGKTIPLRVCWRSSKGDNCCKCEKCFRTITELLAAGADPAQFGFDKYRDYYTFPAAIETICNAINSAKPLGAIWESSRRVIVQKWDAVFSKSPHADVLGWLKNHDLVNEVFLSPNVIVRLKWLIRSALKSRITKDYWLLDAPNHANVGDMLIYQGELDFLKEVGHKRKGIGAFTDSSLPHIKDGDLVLFHGGGSFGDLWGKPHEYRKAVMLAFPNNPYLIFPQSVWYEDMKKCKEDAKFFADFKLTICVRDQQSYDFLKAHFKNEILLVPDMAFYVDVDKWRLRDKCESKGALVVRRSDKEARSSVELDAISNGDNVTVSDWPTFKEDSSVYWWRRRLWESPIARWFFQYVYRPYVLRTGVRFVDAYDKVYTTRLHAGILAALLGKREIVMFDNSYGKISGVYNAWLKDEPNIKLGGK